VLPNRLTRAKQEIERLIDRLEGDRVGLILFAGDAFIQCPLTLDYSAIRLFLDIASPSQIPTPGTDFGAALRRAAQVLSGVQRDPGESDRTRALLIVSDGENHAEVETALAIAKEANLVIFAAGVGEDRGAPIPEFRAGRRVGFKKDQAGNTVVTKLEEETLKRLANDGGYFRVTRTSSSMLEMIDALKRLDRQAFDSEIFEEYDEKFQWPLAVGLLFLVVEVLVRDHRRRSGNPDARGA
jgi:Ca-activated chloride channel family protein